MVSDFCQSPWHSSLVELKLFMQWTGETCMYTTDKAGTKFNTVEMKRFLFPLGLVIMIAQETSKDENII